MSVSGNLTSRATFCGTDKYLPSADKALFKSNLVVE